MVKLFSILLLNFVLIFSHLAEASTCCADELDSTQSTASSIDHSHSDTHKSEKNHSCNSDCHHCHHSFVTIPVLFSFHVNYISTLTFSSILLQTADFLEEHTRPPVYQA